MTLLPFRVFLRIPAISERALPPESIFLKTLPTSQVFSKRLRIFSDAIP
jgi:hypothetical protein